MAAKARKTVRRGISPITWRIFAVNLLALAFLFAGMFYLDEYRRGLIAAELATMRSEANLFAAAIGESATFDEASKGDGLIATMAQQMVRRLVEASRFRARLFREDGALVADSLLLGGPGGGVQIEELPAPRTEGQQLRDVLVGYDRVMARLWGREDIPPYHENAVQTARDYPEVMLALSGESATTVRSAPDGGMILSVAVPVNRYKRVLAALMITKGSAAIDAAVLKVRLDVLKWFLLALGVTILLSIYLARTIANPILRLATAAERVRRDRHRRYSIPDFKRSDEIGQLAAALRDMTQALWLRIDAIERFAADVAHELKNPLTSMRSAVETAARINDPDRRQKLMNIILEDVGRLDRLISDISDASRLDAELSRENSAPVDIRRMLAALIEVMETTAVQHRIVLALVTDGKRDLMVNGVESSPGPGLSQPDRQCAVFQSARWPDHAQGSGGKRNGGVAGPRRRPGNSGGARARHLSALLLGASTEREIRCAFRSGAEYFQADRRSARWHPGRQEPPWAGRQHHRCPLRRHSPPAVARAPILQR